MWYKILIFFVFIAYSYCEPVTKVCAERIPFFSFVHGIGLRKISKKYILKYNFIYEYIFLRQIDCINENANNYILCDLHKR